MLTFVDTLIGFAGVMLLLSLLVTAVVQGAGALLDFRGQNLLWGVKLLVKRAIPALKDDVKVTKMAHEILKHETLNPHGKLAAAIRSDEFIRILTEVAGKDPDQYADMLKKAKDGWEQVYKAAPVDDIAALFPEDVKKAGEVIKRLRDKARADMGDLKAWFDTVMDRTTERFVKQTRQWTIGTAVFLAVFMQIDSLGMLQQISSNPELRARLVQSAESTIKLADEQRAKDRPLATEALEGVVKPESVPKGLTTRAEGLRWIADNVPEAQRASVVEAYEKRFDALLPERVRELAEAASGIRRQLGSTDLVVMSPRRPLSAEWLDWWGQDWRHVAGVLLTIVFLSLGGPFWYNMLRQLANLRPLLAGKVDKDEAS